MSMLPNPVITKREDLDNDELTFEEKRSDAIYQVTYRKVFNHNNNTNQNDPISHLNNDGLVYSKIRIKQIKFGTVEKLVDSFTNDNGELDSNTTCTFLATYRTFTNSKIVLNILFKKYENIFPATLDMTEETRVLYLKSFRSIITTWLDSYGEDFDEPPSYDNLKLIESFCIKHMPNSTDLVNYLYEKLKLFLNMRKIKEQESLRQLELEKQQKFEELIKTENEKQTKFKKLPNSRSEVDLSNINIALITDESHKPMKPPQPQPLSNITQSQILNPTKKTTYQRSLSNTSIRNNSINVNGESNINNTTLKVTNQKITFKHQITNQKFKSIVNLNIKFKEIDELFFAEQLTFIDKELFQRVLPYQCLGAAWSSRKKVQNQNISNFESMNLFIEQFNIITFIVQGTVLEKPIDLQMSPYKRAKIIEKWIRIALHLRNLKNFSSLNAIVQGLDTQCVSRLEKTWNEVSNESKNQLNELIEFFSQDNNQQLFRETLMKEGTAKFASVNIGINATLSKKAKEKLIQQRNNSSDQIGTIPFLGTFLRDLEYIHSQYPTRNEDGLINFAKKRKEFEVIAQIKLLQRAAQFYKFDDDQNFKKWLKTLPSYNEETNYDYSYQIEPRSIELVNTMSNSTNSSNIVIQQPPPSLHRKKTSFSHSSRCDSSESINSLNNHHLQQTLTNTNRQHSRNSSNASSDVYNNHNNSIGSGSLNGLSVDTPNTALQNGNSSINSFISSYSPTQVSSSTTTAPNNNLLAKVNIVDNNANSVFYKKIMIKDSDRCKDVKRTILSKFNMETDKFDKYSLIQVFSDGHKDLLINDNCNVYYAAKQDREMQFVLKLKETNSNGTLSNRNSSSESKFFTKSSPKPMQRSTLHDQNNKNAMLPPPGPSGSSSSSSTTSNHHRRASWHLLKNILS